jgi:hypothetical protein
MFNNFLELSGGFAPSMRGQVRLPTHIDGIESRRESTDARSP